MFLSLAVRPEREEGEEVTKLVTWPGMTAVALAALLLLILILWIRVRSAQNGVRNLHNRMVILERKNGRES